MTQIFSERLLNWYDSSGRKDLPWQGKPPYQVWLSEIMLQQTQVSTVIDYYQRFIEHFPTITSLAKANLEQVLSLWSGLGYYARARNLHKTAVIISEDYQGEFPRQLEQLIALPGIGRSTAGAILSLAYKQRQAILDGNVKRVLTRYAGITGWPGQRAIEQKLWQLAEKLLPEQRVDNYIQAQMDLGATVCLRTQPQCTICPLQHDCQGYLTGNPSQFPTKKLRKPVPQRHTYWLVMIKNNNEVLLNKRPNSGIWGGLWSFPEFDNKGLIEDFYQRHWPHDPLNLERLPTIEHIFTHYKLDIYPYRVQSIDLTEGNHVNNNLSWFDSNRALALGLPAPVKKLITILK